MQRAGWSVNDSHGFSSFRRLISQMTPSEPQTESHLIAPRDEHRRRRCRQCPLAHLGSGGCQNRRHSVVRGTSIGSNAGQRIVSFVLRNREKEGKDCEGLFECLLKRRSV
jgi:radical SAM protein with 4Fe4S-binding SPASM domain